MMYLLCSVMIVTGFILVALVGVFSVLTDLLAMSEDGVAQHQARDEGADWGNDFGGADRNT
jgi:TRAP-type mannitol/chloroaromatic compound transport system permease small subunit